MERVKKNLAEMLFWHKAVSQDIANLKRKIQETIFQIEDIEYPEKKIEVERAKPIDKKTEKGILHDNM